MEVVAHPRLLIDAFTLTADRSLSEYNVSVLDRQPEGLRVTDEVKASVRNLLRHGGFKPTGRSKPASEYLVKAAGEGRLAPINLAVDLCNVVSLHSGLPISVIDLDLAQPPYRIEIVHERTSYVFNPGGQELDVTGLVCFWDAVGPCGSPVKDSQRTKTRPETRQTMSIIWGDQECAEQVRLAGAWYRELARDCGLTL
jgi:DNA/RNA-binding domain of Phe-tRNA-synthetase-like protein